MPWAAGRCTALAIAAISAERASTRPSSRAVFRGGFDKLREAGVALLGGHTVRDNEVKFGYAVTGEVDPDRVLSNAGAKPGDVLFLTKPIGTGIIGDGHQGRPGARGRRCRPPCAR